MRPELMDLGLQTTVSYQSITGLQKLLNMVVWEAGEIFKTALSGMADFTVGEAEFLKRQPKCTDKLDKTAGDILGREVLQGEEH